MNSEISDEMVRLSTLFEVVRREVNHLQFSWHQLFDLHKPDLQWLETLDSRPEEAVILEAFVSRFARLQDTLAGKLIPAWLTVLQEDSASQLENLTKAEKLGVLNNTEDWLAARHIRNQLVHEYVQNLEDMLQAIEVAQEASKMFYQTYDALLAYTKRVKPELTPHLP